MEGYVLTEGTAKHGNWQRNHPKASSISQAICEVVCLSGASRIAEAQLSSTITSLRTKCLKHVCYIHASTFSLSFLSQLILPLRFLACAGPARQNAQ